MSPAAWARARLAHCRAAIVADPEQREALYDEALGEHGESPRPFERARTELAYGAFLRRHRRRVDAREHLRPALETFVALEANSRRCSSTHTHLPGPPRRPKRTPGENPAITASVRTRPLRQG